MKFSTIVFSVVLTVMASPLLAQNGGTECPVPDPKAGMKSLCYALKTSVTYDACLKNMSNAAAKGKCFGIPKDPAVTCDNACKDQGVLKKTICSKSCLNFLKTPGNRRKILVFSLEVPVKRSIPMLSPCVKATCNSRHRGFKS